jgi:sigma-B regulation protein RsbU (phosphoserine phosphatase)
MALYLLDVSGHGVKSALLSMTAMNAIRTRTLPEVDFLDPAQVLAGLNQAFQMDLYEGMYFTIWYGVYERGSRRLVFGSAGHPPGLLLTRGEEGVRVDKLGEPGFFIGMLPQALFTTESLVVPPASNLFLFSDGAYEITQPDESMWTLEDFAHVLAQYDPAQGPAPLAEVEQVIRRVRGVNHFEDDVSILEVRFGA